MYKCLISVYVLLLNVLQFIACVFFKNAHIRFGLYDFFGECNESSDSITEQLERLMNFVYSYALYN